MRRSNIWHVWLILSLTFLSMFISNCTSPNNPEPIQENDYVYFFQQNDPINYLYKYNPEDNRLDSLYLTVDIDGFVIHPNGNTAYLYTSTGTQIFDLENQLITSSFPYQGKLIFSKHAKYISVVDNQRMSIVDASDNSIVYTDSSAFFDCVFSDDENYLYSVKKFDSVIQIININDNFAIESKRLNISYNKYLPSPDNKFLYVLRTSGPNKTYFEVYDLAHDSLVFQFYHAPGQGKLTYSKDNKLIFITTPGEMISNGSTVYAPPYFYVYNTTSRQISEINTLNLPNDETDSIPGIIAQEVAVTADGTWVTVTGLSGTGSYIAAANLDNLVISKTKKVTEKIYSWWNLTSAVKNITVP